MLKIEFLFLYFIKQTNIELWIFCCETLLMFLFDFILAFQVKIFDCRCWIARYFISISTYLRLGRGVNLKNFNTSRALFFQELRVGVVYDILKSSENSEAHVV